MPNRVFPVATGRKLYIRSVKRNRKLQLVPLVRVIRGGFRESVLRLGIVLVPRPDAESAICSAKPVDIVVWCCFIPAQYC